MVRHVAVAASVNCLFIVGANRHSDDVLDLNQLVLSIPQLAVSYSNHAGIRLGDWAVQAASTHS